MAYKITSACIHSHACIPVCPHNAIYKAGENWSMADGTNHPDNTTHAALSGNITFIVADKCTECVGTYDTPNCVDLCPTGAIIKDLSFSENSENLLKKKKLLQG